MKLLAAMLILAACTAPPHHHIQVRQTLLHGSDVALLSGCQRGVIRWHWLASGQYPQLIDVALFCEDVRRSFQDEVGEGNGKT